MNDTNNNSVVNNSVGTQPQTTATPISPQPQTTTPVAPLNTVPVGQTELNTPEVTQNEPIAPVAPDNNSTSIAEKDINKPENNANENDGSNKSIDNNENTGKREFPFAAIIIGIILIIIALLYYFFYITPTRVLDEAIEDIFDNIKNIASSITNPVNDTLEIDLNGKLKTAGRDIDEQSDITSLNNLNVDVIIETDLTNMNLGTTIKSDIKDIESMTYPVNIDLGIDYIDEHFYFEIGDKVAKYDSSNNVENLLAFNFDRINNFVEIFDEMKDQVLNIVDEDQLSRKITTKKINNQTAIAIKAHVKFDNKDISDIYYEGFNNLKKDNDFIKAWASVFAISETEAADMLEYIYNRDVKTQNIEVNLYMNLANTELIGLDVTVDNYFVEISSLNGFYYIDFKYTDKEKSSYTPVLDLEVEYDTFHGVLNGIGALNIQTGNLVVQFDYVRLNAADSNVMIGNTLDFKFYNKNSKKPFATLDCTLDLEYNKKLNIANVDEAVNIMELDNQSLSTLLNIKNKLVYETLFVTKKLVLNKVPDAMAEPILKEFEVKINGIIEKELVSMAKKYFSDLASEDPKKLQMLLVQGQKEMMEKISFMSIENQQEILAHITMIKQQLLSKQNVVQNDTKVSSAADQKNETNISNENTNVSE